MEGGGSGWIGHFWGSGSGCLGCGRKVGDEFAELRCGWKKEGGDGYGMVSRCLETEGKAEGLPGEAGEVGLGGLDCESPTRSMVDAVSCEQPGPVHP